ncbi:hypothetical protein CXH53_24295 [Salmonella enterica]|nr:hypothetical protein [Salmonella enterica]EBU4577742.1 hypothetical protein [Salmonella enterica]
MGSCAAPSAKGDDKFITTDYLQQCPFFCHPFCIRGAKRLLFCGTPIVVNVAQGDNVALLVDYLPRIPTNNKFSGDVFYVYAFSAYRRFTRRLV